MSLLDIDHLHYQYHNDSRILFYDFNLHLWWDNFVVLTGASGTGKTTLIKMILWQIFGYTGTIHFEGKNIKHMSKREIQLMRRDIGCIFQDYKLVPHHTIEQNITLPLSIQWVDHHHIKELYDQVCGILNISFDDTHHIDQLSWWEKQKIAIARSLISQPKLFIADEPTGNLDQNSSKLIVDLIIKLHKHHIPVLFITHDLVLVDYISSQISITSIQL
jgi:cell division transport system ATP-binding protein